MASGDFLPKLNKAESKAEQWWGHLDLFNEISLPHEIH